MPFSPPPDVLYQTVHPVTGITTTWMNMVGSDLSFARASASYSVFSGDGGINPFGADAAPLKIRTFKFDFIHAYQAGETYTQWRDKVMTAVGHGLLTQFFVKCGDGSLRMGFGNCNVSNMKETRDAMVLFTCTIEFECVNPYLTDQYETGTPRWDNGLSWDVGHAIYSLAASATLTGGTFTLSWNGRTTVSLPDYALPGDIQFALDTASGGAIPLIAYSYANEKPPFTLATPAPVLLSAKSPGVFLPVTMTPSGITGGTLTLSLVQAGSAATPNLWDFSPNFFTLNGANGATTHTITSTGNASDRDLILTVNGPISAGYYIYNLSIPGGMSGHLGLQMTEALNVGESHVYDFGRWSVKKQASSNTFSSWQYLVWPPGQADLFRIDSGTNVILIQQNLPFQTTATADINTRNHYV